MILKFPNLKQNFSTTPELFLFSQSLLHSFTESFKLINKDENLNPREKTDVIRTVLAYMLYENSETNNVSSRTLSDNFENVFISFDLKKILQLSSS